MQIVVLRRHFLSPIGGKNASRIDCQAVAGLDARNTCTDRGSGAWCKSRYNARSFATPCGCSCTTPPGGYCATPPAHVRLGSDGEGVSYNDCDHVDLVRLRSDVRLRSLLCDFPPGGRVRLGSLMESMGRMQNIIKRGLMLIAVAGLVQSRACTDRLSGA